MIRDRYIGNNHKLRRRRGMVCLLSLILMLILCGCESLEVLLPYKGRGVIGFEEEDWEEEEPEEDLADEEPLEEEPVEEPAEELAEVLPEETLPEEPVEEEPVEEPVEEPAEEPVQVEKSFTPGMVNGQTYENQTLGFGLTMDADWTFATAEEIAQQNGFAEPATTETATAYLGNIEDPREFVDMDVLSGGLGNEISVSVIDSLYVAADDMAALSQETGDVLVQQLIDEGYENVQSSVRTMDFLGEMLSASVVTCSYQGTQVNETQLHGIRNGYFFTVSFLFFGEDQVDQVISNFYKITGEAL